MRYNLYIICWYVASPCILAVGRKWYLVKNSTQIFHHVVRSEMMFLSCACGFCCTCEQHIVY